jgi:hypothetical protein
LRMRPAWWAQTRLFCWVKRMKYCQLSISSRILQRWFGQWRGLLNPLNVIIFHSTRLYMAAIVEAPVSRLWFIRHTDGPEHPKEVILALPPLWWLLKDTRCRLMFADGDWWYSTVSLLMADVCKIDWLTHGIIGNQESSIWLTWVFTSDEGLWRDVGQLWRWWYDEAQIEVGHWFFDPSSNLLGFDP